MAGEGAQHQRFVQRIEANAAGGTDGLVDRPRAEQRHRGAFQRRGEAGRVCACCRVEQLACEARADADETELIGCVYVYPPEKVGSDADISWWVREEYVGSEVERAFDETVPKWIEAEWPLEAPYFVGHSISWDDWLALPMAD